MIPYIETHIEDACNLKCKGCSHFSCIAQPKKKDIVEFDNEFKRLSELWNIPIIRIMGGEPLLNPDFMEYLKIARRHFPTSRVCLVTNGILINKLVTFVDEINKLHIDVTASDYHMNGVDLSVLKLFRMHSVHEKGDMYNISLDLDGFNDEAEMFDKCDIHRNRWFYFQDGMMFHCCIGGNIDTFRRKFMAYNLPSCESLGISIFDNTKEQIEAFLRQPSDLCKHCRTDIRQGTCSPHEITKGEIKEWTCQ